MQVPIVCAIALPVLLAMLPGASNRIQPASRLNLIVLKAEAGERAAGGGPQVQKLSTRDFPLTVSRLVTGWEGQLPWPARLPVPPQTVLIDVHTIKAAEEPLAGSRKVPILNNVSGTRYELTLSPVGDAFEIELKGQVGRDSFENIVFATDSKATVIVSHPLKGGRSLFFALTHLDVPEESPPGRIDPKLIRSPTPRIPPELVESGWKGLSLWRVLVPITRDGKVDPGDLLILDCDHPAFVHWGMEALEGWVFEPGRQNGEAVAVVAIVEVSFDVPDP